MNFLRPALCLSVLLLMPCGAVDFNKDIKPILKARCYECHSESAKKEKAGYVFDNLERFKGDIGPKGQIVPGDVERSNFLELLTRDKDPMPPSGKDRVTPKELKLIRTWIEEGASLEKGSSGGTSKPSGLPPRKPEPPPGPLLDWVSSDAEAKVVKARFVRLSGDAVVIKKEDGKTFKVPLTRLSAESQEQAKKLAQEEAAAEKP